MTIHTSDNLLHSLLGKQAKCASAPITSMVGDPLLTNDQAAAMLGVDPETLVTWRCTRRVNLPFVKLGRMVRYRIADLDRFIEEHVVNFDAVDTQPSSQIARRSEVTESMVSRHKRKAALKGGE